jgi:hypothetical protein
MNNELESIWKEVVVEHCGSYSCMGLAFQVLNVTAAIAQPVLLPDLNFGSTFCVVTVCSWSLLCLSAHFLLCCALILCFSELCCLIFLSIAV